MPVADPRARPDRPLRIDTHLPGADYLSTHTIEVELPPAEVWRRLPRAIHESRMGFGVTVLFRAADLLRGDVRFRRRDPVHLVDLRKGEDIGFLMGSYEPGAFVLVEVEEERELVVHAEHRYAEGVFGTALEPLGEHRTLAYLITRARFTGTLPSRLYRLAVTGLRRPIVEGGLRQLKSKLEAEPRD